MREMRNDQYIYLLTVSMYEELDSQMSPLRGQIHVLNVAEFHLHQTLDNNVTQFSFTFSPSTIFEVWLEGCCWLKSC